MTWVFLAVLMALVDACISLTMQRTKANADLIVFWRGLIPASILTPLIFLNNIALPTHWLFYAATITTSVLVVYTDKIKLTAPQKFGGGPYSRMMSFKVWIIFVMWFMLDSSYRGHL